MGMLEYLATPARQSATLERTEHRPWPLPAEPWVMGQTWEDLLFAHDRGRLYRADIHHLPWEIREADVRIEHNTMPPNGIELPAEAPLCHVAERQDVVIWPLSEVGPERKRASR